MPVPPGEAGTGAPVPMPTPNGSLPPGHPAAALMQNGGNITPNGAGIAFGSVAIGQEQQAQLALDMNDMQKLLTSEIPDCQKELLNSHQNLDLLATYCDENYSKNPDKLRVLEETKEFCTQSLASVAYQISDITGKFTAVLDLQSKHLERLEQSLNNLNCAVDIHREKVARREVGNMACDQLKKYVSSTAVKIRRPNQDIPQTKYQRKRIDYTELDNIGHGVVVKQEEQPIIRKNSVSFTGSDTSSTQGTLSRSAAGSVSSTITSGSGTLRGKPISVPAAPTAPDHYQPGSLAMKSLQNNPVGGDSRRREMSKNIESVGLPIKYEDQQPPEMQRQNSRSSNSDQMSETRSISSSGMGSDYRFPNEVFSGQGSIRSGSVAGDYRLRQEAFRYTTENPALMQQRLGLGGRKQSISSNPAPNIPEDLVYVGGEFRPVIQDEPRPQEYNPYHNQQKPNFVRPQMQLPPHIANLQQQQNMPPGPAPVANMMNQPRPGGMMSPMSPQGLHQQYGAPMSMQNHQQQQRQVKVSQPQVTNLNEISFPPKEVPPSIPHNPPPPAPPSMQAPAPPSNNNIPANLDKYEKVMALYDYTAEQDDELTFIEGQVIFVLKKNDDGWYEGLMPPSYQRGLFPGNYVEPATPY